MPLPLTRRMHTVRERLLDKTINGANLRVELSARFGYGLTVTDDEHTYFFHVPDVPGDPVQTQMVKEAKLPYEDALLRLRRRTHRGSVFVDTCSGCAARAVFYAKSLGVETVYALGRDPHHVALSRKNVLLNDQEHVVKAYWLNLTEEAMEGPYSSLDRFFTDQNLGRLDVLSLDASATRTVTGGGAEAVLGTYGPAVVFWGRDAEEARVKALTDALLAQGYKEPERWTSEILYWTPRV